LSISPKVAPATGAFTLTLTAKNTGKRDGSTPVQVFFRDPFCSPVHKDPC